eukprot:2876205-Pleurochrysis_carterae.AAC.1
MELQQKIQTSALHATRIIMVIAMQNLLPLTTTQRSKPRKAATQRNQDRLMLSAATKAASVVL